MTPKRCTGTASVATNAMATTSLAMAPVFNTWTRSAGEGSGGGIEVDNVRSRKRDGDEGRGGRGGGEAALPARGDRAQHEQGRDARTVKETLRAVLLSATSGEMTRSSYANEVKDRPCPNGSSTNDGS